MAGSSVRFGGVHLRGVRRVGVAAPLMMRRLLYGTAASAAGFVMVIVYSILSVLGECD